MPHIIFTTAFSLFLLMDPIGNIPVYLTILHEIPLKRRLYIIFRENIIALILIILFACFGDNLLNILSISKESIYLAGGIVLFLIAVKMIFPEESSLLNSLQLDGEPLIFPLAIPLIAGPSVLAAVMIYSGTIGEPLSLLISIMIAWTASTIILILAGYLQNLLGIRSIKALERLMGLLLILISINMFLEGVKLLHAKNIL